jgi:hypothetical protein
MHPHKDLLACFFRCLQQSDADRLAECYHPQATHWDPVYGELRGSATLEMWRMLCAQGERLTVEVRDVWADYERGSARWVIGYEFPPTRRGIRVEVDTRFRFRGGLIVDQRDSFDPRRWATMALGRKGRLLGWVGPVQTAVRRKASRELETFISASDTSSASHP